MNTNEITREQISALADGELANQQLDMALAALRQAEGRADWEVYHQIGDVLRSVDMAAPLSAGFSARMAMRLEAEPTIVAPGLIACNIDERPASLLQPRSITKRWTVPSMVAAAAVAAVAFVTTPQLIVAIKGRPDGAADSAVVAGSSAVQGSVIAASAPEGVVLRDPRIDDYLLAHQRFSPSVFSTAQYARSATFSNK
ncbi:sigma-E factor negative regulatory protein [Noviherbaspirillum sp.]|uniref:sigma-E factor negative regulatory protein n=1 Tax=Noviherbaspirillum sp. TaxID=1926288 RepID=UPI002B493CE0|nr:sigma-E factor negative regulatory protein [Noviherbaspirillum sp.]HJV80539.1 sigma-E factor negative regulatory protein [Noviherbaspirillum sp.]